MSMITDERIEAVKNAVWDVMKERHPRQQLDQRRRDAYAYARAALEAVQPERCPHGYGYEDPVPCPACNAEPLHLDDAFVTTQAQTILNCFEGAPSQHAGARLAVYRIVDEYAKYAAAKEAAE